MLHLTKSDSVGGNIIPKYFSPFSGQVRSTDWKSDLEQFFVKGSASDSDQLTLYPEILENLWMMSKRTGIECSGWVTSNNISSAYNINLWIACPILIPVNLEFLWMAVAIGSRAKRRRESGQPYLVLRVKSNEGEINPLVSTEALGWVYISLIQFKKLRPNPKVSGVENKNFHSTLSNARWLLQGNHHSALPT